MFLNKTGSTLADAGLLFGPCWVPAASSEGFAGTGGAVHGSTEHSPEEKSQRLRAHRDKMRVARSVLQPWLQTSAKPLFYHAAPHLLESFHSSVLVANSES